MTDKYLKHDGAGGRQEQEFTVVSTGVAEAGDGVALDAAGKLDNSVLPTGIGADTTILPTSENLAAGDQVNKWSDGGVAKFRKADASVAGKESDGFVLAAVTAPANATVYADGLNSQVTGLTPGVQQFLSTTPGLLTETPPSVTGNVVQQLGKSNSATEHNYERGTPLILA